jgi:hypothetical protein
VAYGLAMSNRKALARAIAVRTKPRFVEIPRERRSKVPFTEGELTAIRGCRTAGEYRWYPDPHLSQGLSFTEQLGQLGYVASNAPSLVQGENLSRISIGAGLPAVHIGDGLAARVLYDIAALDGLSFPRARERASLLFLHDGLRLSKENGPRRLVLRPLPRAWTVHGVVRDECRSFVQKRCRAVTPPQKEARLIWEDLPGFRALGALTRRLRVPR